MKKFETEVRLAREMTLMDATLIGVGAMIGAGIFVLIGIAAGVAGPALILAFVFSGIVATLTAMSYAELGSCFHDAGGGYLWVKEGLPKWNGFLSGWMSWFAHAVACSVYALGFGAYFEHVLREMGAQLPEWHFLSPVKLLAVVITLLLAYINFRGASETGKLGSIVTLAKIAILAIFVAFGLNVLFNRPDWKDALTPFMPHGFGGVFSAMGLTFIAFQGYEVIAQCSEEIQNPKRNIPRAVFLSLLIVVPIYILVALTALVSVHPGALTPWDYLADQKEIALVEVSKTFFIGGGVLLLVGGLISTMSALNATIFSSSRVAFAMGRDRNFPTFFSKVHPQRATPHWAILVTLIIILTMAVTLPIEDVASAASIMFLLLFLQVNFAMISLRKKRPDLDRGFVTPFLPWLTIAGILMLLLIAGYMFEYSPIAWIITIVWIGLGLLVYRVYSHKREIKYVQKVRALEQLEEKQYRILVPVANPASIKDLARVAEAIARRNNAEILFLHVVEVESGKLLNTKAQEQPATSDLLNMATEGVNDPSISVRTMLRISHRVSRGIIDTVEEEGCNFVIMGREKHPRILQRLFSSILDSVIRESPCEVAVLHGRLPETGIRRLVVPYGFDIHSRLAMELAPSIKEHFQSKLLVTMVFEPQIPLEKRQKLTEELRSVMSDNSITGAPSIVHNREILQGILGQARSSDLILMGGRTGDFLKLFFGRSLGQDITEQAPGPVLWVREYEEGESFWQLLFKPVGSGMEI